MWSSITMGISWKNAGWNRVEDGGNAVFSMDFKNFKKSGKKLKKVLAFCLGMLYINKVLDTRLCELNHELRKQRKTFKKVEKSS